MSDANDTDGQDKRVTSLRDLPQAMRPPRDLWAGIESAIAAEGRGASGAMADAVVPPIRSARRITQLRWMAAAATIAALAVGVWIGRTWLPVAGPAQMASTSMTTTTNTTQTPVMNQGAVAVQAAYLSDPKFRQQRAALVKSLEAKLASLPPDTRAKVLSSLATIHKSMQDLEAALGKDPTNALLQELLLNTYQDEMRVLTTVHEASESGEGI